MLLLVALLALTGWGLFMSLISETEILGDLGIRQALFLAWLNDTDSEDEDGDDNADGDNDGERALSDGGGTDMSTLGRGTTPVMEYDGERGNWSWWDTLARFRLGGGNLSLE